MILHLSLILRRNWVFWLPSICHVLSTSLNNPLKCTLYTTLVKLKLTYCFQVWRPVYSQDILKFERRATKFILNNLSLDYRNRLITLKLFPLATWLEIQDILFLVKCLKSGTDSNDLFK